ENSQDSRYWGLLPEPFIVGRAWMVWKSVDVDRGKVRWHRIFKGIE
ncbi:S26 family signal peptidase, partial [Bacteroides heparinolyticus]